ncbi:hypothetical protein ES288_A05G033200v1 [Gossypium darwinii]|nr:hypothetical protein ES288_A05G033200v1 [Gossypium darwinii]TYI25201.1 hypothetical protein ES332_A05G034800v1 [Gossypium tomentosum]
MRRLVRLLSKLFHFPLCFPALCEVRALIVAMSASPRGLHRFYFLTVDGVIAPRFTLVTVMIDY